jgi:hypothetical protein
VNPALQRVFERVLCLDASSLLRKIDMSMITEDEQTFGKNVWVYCSQHLRPHLTGWCTVGVKDKTLLTATGEHQAYDECRAAGFKLFTATALNAKEFKSTKYIDGVLYRENDDGTLRIVRQSNHLHVGDIVPTKERTWVFSVDTRLHKLELTGAELTSINELMFAMRLREEMGLNSTGS